MRAMAGRAATADWRSLPLVQEAGQEVGVTAALFPLSETVWGGSRNEIMPVKRALAWSYSCGDTRQVFHIGIPQKKG